MSLSISTDLRLGDLTLTVDLDGLHGVTALVGPNGAGKTTLLRAAAGLERADRIELDGEALTTTPPHGRRFGLVLAEPLLRPSSRVLTAVSIAASRHAALECLALLGCAELADRRCGSLSSGEAARVALARALAAEPRVLLLDEPLGRLDAQTRPSVRAALRSALAAYPRPVLLVTHDVVDVAALCNRVVVLESGRVVQDATPAELTARPRSTWAARFAGLELLRGTAAGTSVALDDGGSLELAEAHHGAVLVSVRASSITVSAEQPHGSARNTWPAAVVGVEPLGDRVRVLLDGPPRVAADLTPAAVTELRLDVGSRVWASVKATDLEAYPA